MSFALPGTAEGLRAANAAGRPLRVLVLISYVVDTGGAERFALGLATHLPRDRFEVSVCFTRTADPAALGMLREAGVSYTGLGRRGKLHSHRLGGLIRLLRAGHFDILHSHMFGSNLWGSVIGRACGVPVVLAHEHTWSYEGNPVRAWLDGRVIGRLATKFLAVSHADARRMVQIEHVPAQKVIVMPTAYIPRASPGSDLRHELGFAPSTPVIATAVVLRRQKAVEVLLEAYAKVLSRLPDARLVIAGDGPERSMLEDRARTLGLDGRVAFLGARQDIDAILASSDVAVLSSDYEGMPLFAFESIAAHTPLVATRVGALPDVFEDRQSGLLVAPRDPDALAAGLVELLEDPAMRARLARTADAQLPPYMIDAVALRFAELYERLATDAAR